MRTDVIEYVQKWLGECAKINVQLNREKNNLQKIYYERLVLIFVINTNFFINSY